MTMVDRDAVTLFPHVVNDDVRDLGAPPRRRPGGAAGRRARSTAASSTRSSTRSTSTTMRVIPTGGDAFEMEREQWDDGNNVVCLEPGVVVAYERNIDTNTALRKAGIEVHHDRRLRARPRPRRLALHDLPDRARRGVLRRMYNLRNRSFLKEIDFTPRRAAATCSTLAAALKTAKYAGTEMPRLDRQGDRADLREDARPARGARSRSPPTTRARTSPTSIRPARRSATRSRSPTPRACSAGCTTRSSTAASAQADVEELAALRRRARSTTG